MLDTAVFKDRFREIAPFVVTVNFCFTVGYLLKQPVIRATKVGVLFDIASGGACGWFDVAGGAEQISSKNRFQNLFCCNIRIFFCKYNSFIQRRL
jgi:hypothetical protein